MKMGSLNTQKTTTPPGVASLAERVLVADGNSVLCELAKYHLESEGYEVDTISNAPTLTYTDISQYHAIVLDYELLGEETYDFIESHYITGNAFGVALIITHTPTHNSDVYETLDAGADALLRKPYSMNELTARLKAIMRRHQPNKGKAK